jgi:hypothetical protein
MPILTGLEEFDLDGDQILRLVDALQILGHPAVLLARGYDPEDVGVGIVDDLRPLRRDVNGQRTRPLPGVRGFVTGDRRDDRSIEGRNGHARHLRAVGLLRVGE